MRHVISTLVIMCLMLVSAAVSHANPSESNVAHATYAAETLSVDPAVSETGKDECPCKKETSAAKFVCGVTLAFDANEVRLDVPAPVKARYAILKSTATQSFIDRLKRPPRSIL